MIALSVVTSAIRASLTPFNPAAPGTPLGIALIKNVGKGSKITATGLPAGPSLYLVAFIDDNDTINTADPKPDSGDPVLMDNAPFSASPGKTVTRTLSFQFRIP